MSPAERSRAPLSAAERYFQSATERLTLLLVLRSDGLSYIELASALDLNPASVGTLLARAQQAFRKEDIKRYGQD